MGKVIESKGLNEFLEKGTVTHVENHKPQKKASAPEKPPEKPAEKPTEVKAEIKEEPKVEEPVEKDEEVPVLSEDSRKYVNKQHRLRKEAEEAARDAETFAKTQYDRARLAEERAAELEKRLNEAQPPKKAEPELKEPEETDPQWTENGQFNWRKFTKAQAAFEAAKAVAEERKKQEESRVEAERAEHITRIRQSAEAARKELADFDEVMEAAKGTEADIVPQFVLNYIYESDKSAYLAYHLAKNPDEAQRIARMKPILGLAELGKLEDRLVKPKPDAPKEPKEEPVAVKETPPPITPISAHGSATVNTDPAKMSYRELREYERTRRQKR